MISPNEVLFFEYILSVTNEGCTSLAKAAHLKYLGVIFEHGLSYCRPYYSQVESRTIESTCHGKAVGVIRVFIIPVVAKLIGNVEHDQQAGGDTYGQAADVEQRVKLVFEQAPYRYLHVVFDHFI